VKVDILQKGPGGWDIYEVKSSSGLKDVYLNDTALQYYVAKGSGLNISKASVVYINNHYVRAGEIEPKKLFIIDDVTDTVEKMQAAVSEQVSKLKGMLLGDMPDIDIGEHCEAPYPCDFHGHCWQHIPENSVFGLRRTGANKFSLYRQGIVSMKDIPTDILNRHQRTQVEAFMAQSEVIDRPAIAAFLETLFYPLCFLDFETIYTAIPLFDGTRPYQQIPFQFSLHLMKNAESGLQHFEFLAGQGEDPRRGLLERLLKMVPENACIVVYTAFEAKRMSDLADWFPECRERINQLIDNIRDLSSPFRKMDYYHWQMNGSYSIKKVLPQLVPDMSYDTMEIRDGGMAIDAWFKMRESDDLIEIAQIRQALLEYCNLDTLAMVKILDRLTELSA